MLPVRPKETASLTLPDGIRLDADVYRPDAPGEFPVLLMRQPYGRAIASTVVYAHPSWYAAHGYIVVIQDVRGRGSSQGSFYPFASEISDGYESVQWAANLSGSSGLVGMYGFSYQGLTQLYAASAQPPALKAICPAMMGYDLCADMAYENGAIMLQGKVGWAIQLAAETARLRGDETAYMALFRASRSLPLHDPLPARPEVLQTYAPDSFYFDWLAHPDPEAPYWHRLSPRFLLAEVDLPMLNIGGWFDPYLRGNLKLHRAMSARSQYPQHLIVGPWPHIPWGHQLGSVDYGPAANSPVDRLQVRWFDHWLKGSATLDADPVRLFEMGSNVWRTFAAWPSPEPRPLYLATTGLAAMAAGEGSLSESQPETPTTDTFVHDPWRPVPSLGGHCSYPPGSFDRAALDCRSDVLTYTSDWLSADLHLAGEVWVEVEVSADVPSFDLCAVLSEVRPGGGAFNFTQGYLRLPASPARIPLQATCIQIPAGHALRLSLSASCFPAFLVNPGSGSRPEESRAIEARIATLSLRCNGGSRLLLPASGD